MKNDLDSWGGTVQFILSLCASFVLTTENDANEQIGIRSLKIICISIFKLLKLLKKDYFMTEKIAMEVKFTEIINQRVKLL